MAAQCPCCGAALDPHDDRLLIAEDIGIVVANGRSAYLARSEMEILLSLVAARGIVRTKEQLMRATNPDVTGHDDREIKLVDVFICKLRKKLKPLGVEIETAWGRGYRMTIKEGENA